MGSGEDAQWDAFIGYPQVARDWKVRLEQGLEARGVQCFSDARLEAGDLAVEELATGLARSGVLIALWHSEASAQSGMFAELEAADLAGLPTVPVFLGEKALSSAPSYLRSRHGVIVSEVTIERGPFAETTAAWEIDVDKIADLILSARAPDRLDLRRGLATAGPGPGWDDISDRTRRVLERAAGAEARDVGTRAMVFGLLSAEDGNGVLQQIFDNAGVEVSELFDVMQRLPARGQFQPYGVTPRPLKALPDLSPNGRRALENAWSLTRTAGLSKVTNSMLLLAIVASYGTTATTALRELLGFSRVFALMDDLLRDVALLERASERQPSTAVTSDLWTLDDDLDHELFADAIAAFICDQRSRPPLTIGIKGRWGAGKTSVMRKVRHKLDPPSSSEPAGDARLTVEELLRDTKDVAPERAADRVQPVHQTDAQRVTIWFNAWKYQSRNQLWAGLAHSILDQVDGRLSAKESDRLWASLQLRRLELPKLRREFYSYVLARALPGAMVALLGAILSIAALLFDAAALFGTGPLLAAGLGLLGRQISKATRHEVSRAVPKLVEQPDYGTEAGYLHLVDSDLRRILDAAGATRERPFVVFIDDLDRCSYQTVAEVIEALNVFLAGDFANCVFVIAMEPELIAAQVRAAYEPLFKQLGHAEGDLGWRFLEKMVQLPLSLPLPGESQTTQLVEGVLGARREDQTRRSWSWDATEVTEARKRLKASGAPKTLDDVMSAVTAARASTADDDAVGGARDSALQQAARLEFAELFDDTRSYELVLRYARDLTGNPREIKRFVNVFRFFAYLDFWRRLAGRSSPGIEGAAKLARVSISWPSIARALVMPSGLDEHEPLIARLERASQNDDWESEIASLPEALQVAIGPSSRLRTVLREAPDIGEAATQFL